MKPARAERTALAVVAVLLMLALLAVGTLTYRKHQWAQNRLAEVDPRYARTLGLAGSRTALAQAAARQEQTLRQYAYGPEQDASQVGNDALQRVRDVLGGAGLRVVSSQALPPRDDVAGFERIPIDVRFEGPLSGVQQALAAVTAQVPAMVVETVTLQVGTVARPDSATPLSGTVSVSVLRRRV